MEYALYSVLALVMTYAVLVDTSPGEAARKIFNETAPSNTIYLLRKVERKGVLEGIQAYISQPKDFRLQVWANIKLPLNEHGSVSTGPPPTRSTEPLGDDRPDEASLLNEIYTLVHETRVDGASLRAGFNQLSFSEKTEHDRNAYCPYVYEGDFVGILSTDGDLPIPYMKYPADGNRHPMTLVSDITNKTERLLTLSFEKAWISFAVENPKVEQAPRPSPLAQFILCRDGRRANTSEHASGSELQEIFGADERETIVTTQLETERDNRQEIQLPTSLYISMGTVAAIGAIAIITSVVMCLRFRTQSKFHVPVLSREGLVPVLTGSAPGSPSFKQDPRLSVRNPVYGDDCDFLRSISIAGSDDSRVSYFVVPSSGVLSPDGFDHYEEVRFVRPSSSRRGSQKQGENTKSSGSSKPHTYLDLLPDDDSGVVRMNHSGTSVEEPVPEEHKPVSRAPSGPYCKIDD